MIIDPKDDPFPLTDPQANDRAGPTHAGPAQSGPYAGVRRFAALHQARDHATHAAQPAADPLLAVCARVLGVDEVRTRAGGHRLLLEDLAGRQKFVTMPVRDNQALLASCFRFVETGQRVVLFGRFPDYPRGHEKHDGPDRKIEVADLRRLTRQASLLAPAPDEEAEALALARTLIAERRVLPYMIQEAREILGVQPDALSARFQLGEVATALQALSFAQVLPELNSRLSIFAFSGPGTGKTLLGRYADLFAAVGELVQPGLVTPPGLGASVSLGTRGWSARPGVLPRCSGGVCVLDDMQRIEQKHLKGVQAILMTTLEQGLIKTSKAASVGYEARVGLFMAANRLSLLDGRADSARATPQERAKNLSLPFDVFSRVDLVLHLGDGDDAVRSAMKIASQPACPEHPPGDDEDQPTRDEPTALERRKRRLKLVVALVKDLIPLVDLAPVEKDLEDITLQMAVVMREYTSKLAGAGVDEDSYDADGLVRRVANTVRKLAGAFARGDGRSVAEKRDLDRAWDLLKLKMEVLRYIAGETDRLRPLPSREQQVDEALDASDRRWQQILLHFGGQEARVESVSEALGYTEKAVVRELQKRQVPRDGIWYSIPTVGELLSRADRPRDRDEALRAELSRPEVEAEVEPEVPAGLLAVPEAARPAIGMMECMDRNSQAQVADLLFGLALRRDEGRWRGRVVSVTSYLAVWANRSGWSWRREEMQGLEAWLSAPEWEERGLRALSAFAASGMGPHLVRRLLPPGRPADEGMGERLLRGLAVLRERAAYPEAPAAVT